MLRLYDTRTRQLEPIGTKLLRMYTCGPTVYRYAHIGNLRSYLLSDLVRRVLELSGARVVVCQNITDVGHMAEEFAEDNVVEDKMLAEARRTGRGALDIAAFFADAFRADTGALNIRPPEHAPRATESIPLMIELAATLVELEHAYVTSHGDVYFDARSFPSYGDISGNRLDQLRPGHRFEGAIDPHKNFHADWVLWRHAGSRRELIWDSPWGEGFPGWHVECSAMSLHYLGTQIELHTGGIDLRFPHHEDERAQSNALAGHEVVRNWVHGEHLLFEGRKMAKSAGNVVLVADVVSAGLDPLSVRLALMQHRYRQQMNLTWDVLRTADRLLARWRSQVAQWSESPSAPLPKDAVRRVLDAVEDDLDMPTAIRELRTMARNPDISPGAKFEAFVYLDRVLGLDLARDVGTAPVLPTGAADLLEARQKARSARDWAAADRLRDELVSLGVRVTDTAEGQRWTC